MRQPTSAAALHWRGWSPRDFDLDSVVATHSHAATLGQRSEAGVCCSEMKRNGIRSQKRRRSERLFLKKKIVERRLAMLGSVQRAAGSES